MKFNLFLLLLLASAAVQAQSGKITGKVLTSDKSPAEYINVVLKGTTKGDITNAQGEFLLKDVKEGDHIIKISFIGLETKEVKVKVFANETTVVPDVILNEDRQRLDEVVVTGTKGYKVDQPSRSLRLQTPILETPQNIQIVNSQLLDDQQIFDMLEGVSQNVSGVTKIEHWGNYARLNMRGSQIAAFRNGMNVQMPWGPLAEDMSMVERVEFVKGPAGFMMANGEPGGFYNVVTKKPSGITKREISLTLGSFDTYRATLDLDGKLDKEGRLLYRFNVMGQLKGSHRDYEYTNRHSIAPVITYKINDRTSFTAEYTYQFMEMSTIGSAYVFSPKGYGDLPRSFSTAEPNLEPSKIGDHSLFLIFNHKLAPNWAVTAKLAYFNYNMRGSSLWPLSLDEAGNMQRAVSIFDAFNESKIGQIFVNGQVKTSFITHRLLGGLDMSYKNFIADWSQNIPFGGIFNIYDPQHGISADEIPEFDRSESLRHRAGSNIVGQSYTAIYLQDELRFWEDRIRLTLAGRYTTIAETEYGANTDDTKLTPRIGLSVSLVPQTALYALYDQAFVPQTGTDVNGKAFDPITGNNLELGFKRDWADGRWNSTVAIYQITKNNVLTADLENPQYSVQLGQTQTEGVEFDVRGEIMTGLNLTLNYAYTNAEITKDANEDVVGNLVPGFAKHMTNGWLSYGIRRGTLNGLGLSLGYQWQIERSTWEWAESGKALPDYFRLDGGISWQDDKFHVGLNVYNILDDYLFSGAPYDINRDGEPEYNWQTEAPINFRLNIAYKF